MRIDLFGDEVDRLTRPPTPADQRPVGDLGLVELFGCRELLPTDSVRRRAAALVGTEPWGRSAWERIADGQVFDGMESWLPWLVDDEHVLPDLLGPDARVVVVDPRRSRDRTAELLDEEAALAEALGSDLGGRRPGPGASASWPSTGCWSPRCPAAVLNLLPVAESPAIAAVVAQGWDPVFGDRARLAARLSELVGLGYSVTVCAEGSGSARRLSEVLAEEGLAAPVVDTPDAELGVAGVRVVVASLDRGFVVPAVQVAVLAEADVTGRRCPHRRARAVARPVRTASSTTWPLGTTSVHPPAWCGVGRRDGQQTVAGAARLPPARIPGR